MSRHNGSRRAAAVAVSASIFLVAACGGGDDPSDDSVAGVDEADDPADGEDSDNDGEQDGTDSGGAAPDDGRPEIELPDDVELVFDWDQPDDPDEARAVGDAQEFLRAINEGIAEQNPEHPHYQAFSSEGARDYGRTQITEWTEGGWTKSGTDRYFALEVRQADDGTILAVEFCRDNAEMFGKEVESGELVPKEESSEHAQYSHYTISLREPPGTEDFWQAHHVVVEGEAIQCATE